MAWYDNDPKVKKVRRAREDKERDEDIKEARALDKARADSQKGKNMGDRKVVGWFYRNGKRIPIFEKVTSDQRRRDPNPNQLRENVRRLGKSERASRVKDNEEIKERGAKSRAFFQDSKNGRYYKDYDSPEAMNADIKKETGNKGTSLITKEEIGPKREGRRLVASKGDSIAYDDNYIGVKPRPAEGKVTNRRRGLSTHNEGRGSTMYDVEVEGGKTRAVDGAAVTGIRKKGNLRTKPAQDQARLDDAVNGLGRSGYKATAADAKYYLNKTKENKASNNSEMRRRMWGTPDVRGKRRSMYRLPQKKEFANVQPSESYIKYVMKEYGYNRADAIKFIKNRG